MSVFSVQENLKAPHSISSREIHKGSSHMALQCNPVIPQLSKMEVSLNSSLCTTNTDVHVLLKSTHRNTTAAQEKILISVKCPHG
jgi:hypothetical protein